MSSPTAFATHLDADTLALVEKLASARGISADQYAAEAIKVSVGGDEDWLAFLDAGLAALDAGRSISHEEMLARIARRPRRNEAA